jgi:hypothetical protein
MQFVTLISKESLRSMMRAAYASPPGDFVEVGVWRGGSANCLSAIAEQQKRRIWLYDTFAGLPYADEIDTHKAGEFADCDIEEVRVLCPNATIVKGVFPESADPEMAGIAFAHIDVDQYRAVRETALYLQPLMVKGGAMLFDDYDFLVGAKLAVDELYGRKSIELHNGKALVRF